MNKKVLMYLGAIIIVIIVAVICTCKIFKKAESVPTVTDVNDVNNMTNEIEKKKENQNVNSSETEIKNEDKKENKNTSESKEEKAKKIVQDNWGEDDTVYYSYDGIDANGKYIICVREKATTKALYWYYVDVDSGTFEIN